MENDIRNQGEQEKKPEVTISDFSRLLSELSEEDLDKLLSLCLLQIDGVSNDIVTE